MKKAISLLTCLTLFLSVSLASFAASDEAVSAANALHALNLFNGVGTDANGAPIFDLDRTPTRYEAVTMLVRLLGKENEAKAGTWNTPFTDVVDWAKPYVGYAFSNGLTSGMTETTYNGNQEVTAPQYITFVLRALGYSTEFDFQWDKPWELSNTIGLINGQYNDATTSFTRGDIALISYNALSTKVKGQLSTLSESLKTTTSSEAKIDENKNDDYTYLAASDFRRIHRNYSTATANFAYITVYTNRDGHLCVLTDVWYTIRSRYNDITLHNLTTGETINDPVRYYTKLADRTYGMAKIPYLELASEVLDHLGNEQTNGIYVSSDVLDPQYQLPEVIHK